MPARRVAGPEVEARESITLHGSSWEYLDTNTAPGGAESDCLRFSEV
jgi:hypothetical protein